MSEHGGSATHFSFWDQALWLAEAQLRPYRIIRHSRAERIERRARDRAAVKLAAHIALYACINALEAGISPLDFLKRWLKGKVKR